MANLIDDNQLFCFNPLQWIILLEIIKIDYFPTKSIKSIRNLIDDNRLFYFNTLQSIVLLEMIKIDYFRTKFIKSIRNLMDDNRFDTDYSSKFFHIDSDTKSLKKRVFPR